MIEQARSGSQAAWISSRFRARGEGVDTSPPWIHHAAPGRSISMRGSWRFEDQEVGVAALHNSPGVCSWPASVLAGARALDRSCLVHDRRGGRVSGRGADEDVAVNVSKGRNTK